MGSDTRAVAGKMVVEKRRWTAAAASSVWRWWWNRRRGAAASEIACQQETTRAAGAAGAAGAGFPVKHIPVKRHAFLYNLFDSCFSSYNSDTYSTHPPVLFRTQRTSPRTLTTWTGLCSLNPLRSPPPPTPPHTAFPLSTRGEGRLDQLEASDHDRARDGNAGEPRY